MTDKVQKIREEVEKLYNQSLADENRQADRGLERAASVSYGKSKACKELLSLIGSMQEEPVSENNTLRKASEEYLKVLSETPYNNTPITNAQTIVRELITFLDNPSKYNPNHIEELVSEELNTVAKVYADSTTDKVGYKIQLRRAVVYGAKWQKQQMMAKAFDFTNEHNIACVLASECLRNHGWFNRERVFNNLFRHLACVDKLFEGKFSGKTKVIVIKEE